ncbi:MAG: LysR family transcriptional regulator substrate-binding protein [bacterium]|nr:LysR family transcriptional regulator substrate-binding protein [bacterium]
MEKTEKTSHMWLSAEDIRLGKHLEEDVKPVSLEWFKRMPFLFLKEGNDTRIRADKICIHSHFKPKIILLLDQQLTAYNLTCQGMGISFISDTLVKSEKPDPRVVYYRLDHQDSSRNVSFYYKRTRYMKRAVREFLKIADEIV